MRGCLTFESDNHNPMFYQVVGNGANLFVLIVAIIFGFVNALAYVDSQKVKKEQEESGDQH